MRNIRSKNRNIRSYFSSIEDVIIASNGNGGLYWICRKSNASNPVSFVLYTVGGKDRLDF